MMYSCTLSVNLPKKDGVLGVDHKLDFPPPFGEMYSNWILIKVTVFLPPCFPSCPRFLLACSPDHTPFSDVIHIVFPLTKNKKDGGPAASQAGWVGLFDSGGVVHRLGGVQRTLRVLLLWKPHRPRSLHPEALHTGEPLSSAAGQHRVWGQHPGRLLWEQLQTSYGDQVIISDGGLLGTGHSGWWTIGQFTILRVVFSAKMCFWELRFSKWLSIQIMYFV